MKLETTIKLGMSANLIYGFKPTWGPDKRAEVPLFGTKEKPLKEHDIELEAGAAEWGYPEISLHASAEDLLSAVFPFSIVHPADDQSPPHIQPGPLLIGDNDREAAIKSLSATLGVNLLDPNHRYALVKLRREVGSASHPGYQQGVFVNPNPTEPDPALGVEEAFRRHMPELRYGRNESRQPSERHVTPAHANKYLDSFKTFGTHFVSRVTAGDQIFQVFAYDAARFAEVENAYKDGSNPLSGSRAVNFSSFTSDAKRGQYGFVDEYGNILCLSDDEAHTKSLAAGDWHEPTWAKTNSIFAAFELNTRLTLDTLDQNYTQIGLIGIELSPLSLLIEFNRKQAWRRVLKSAMYQKFPHGIAPQFALADQPNYDALLPMDEAGLLSTIATPTINTYKERINLGDLKLVAKEEVKDFTVFANCLQHQDAETTEIPGADVLLVSQIISVGRQNQKSPVLKLTDAAYDAYTLSCQEFYGGLLVTNSAGSKQHVIVDGLRYESQAGGAAGRYDVSVTKDVRTPLPPALLPRIKDSLEFAIVFAEAVVSDREAAPDSEIQDLMRDYLNWVATLIPADYADMDLLELRTRSMDLALTAADPTQGSFVPLLPYTAYEKDVSKILDFVTTVSQEIQEHQRQIEQRKLKELVIDVGKTLNENILATGELLAGVVSANATQAQEMSGFYNAIVEQTKTERDRQQNTVDDLETLLQNARSEVHTAAENYQQAVADWQKMENIKFALTAAVSLFKLGAAIVKPDNAAGALAELANLVTRGQELYALINTSTKFYTSIERSEELIKSAQQDLGKASKDGVVTPASLQWDEINVTFSAVMKAGPDEQSVRSKRIDMENAFSILILRGKALLSAKAELRRLAREVYLNDRRKALNDSQAQRLSELQGTLKRAKVDTLDREAIDLIGLTGSLQAMRKQMLMMLAKSFALQDRALQYRNVQPPTHVESSSLLTFKSAVARQQINATKAETKLNAYQTSITMPIRYKIEGVHASDLTEGKAYQFCIAPNAHVAIQSNGGSDNGFVPTSLDKYVTVKVKSVIASVEGVTCTDSGQHLVKLVYRGNPFFDRDLDRNPVFFRTPPREKIYEYATNGNKPNFTDGGKTWSEEVSPITPFSNWEILMPKGKTNKGIKFSGESVTICLTFVLEARIKEDPLLLARRALRETEAKPRRKRALMATASAAPPKEDVIAAMASQGSALNGWDVVFNMSLDQINQTLAKQYEEFKKSTAYANNIKVETKQQRRATRCEITKFEAEYGYPKLEFLVNNTQTVSLEMQILKGSVQACDFAGKCEDSVEDKLDCDPPQKVDGLTLKADIPISLVEGKVHPQKAGSKTYSVVLDFAKGAFTAEAIKLSDEQKVAFNAAIKAYFVNNPVHYIINTLDLSQIADLEDLRPNQFVFKNLKTPSGERMLQLYIMTGNRPALDYSLAFINNVPEPIPFGFRCSLMISSKLFFGSVLPKSLGFGRWGLKGEVGPNGANKAWQSKFVSGEVRGTADFTAANYTTPGFKRGSRMDDRPIPCGTSFTFSKNQALAWPIADMIVSPTNSGGMELNWNKQEKTSIEAIVFDECGYFPRGTKVPFSSDVTVTAHAKLPIVVAAKDRTQQLKIDISNRNVAISGRMSGGGPCGCDDLQARLNQQLRDQLPAQITNQLNVSFEPISLFALNNLLFPAKSYLTLKEAYVPGDMLILGSFNEGA